jgi:hypothetical protein
VPFESLYVKRLSTCLACCDSEVSAEDPTILGDLRSPVTVYSGVERAIGGSALSIAVSVAFHVLLITPPKPI